MSFGKYFTISIFIVCVSVVLCVERCSQRVFYSKEAVHRDNMKALADCIEKISSTTKKDGKKTSLEEAKQICDSV